MDGAPRLVVHNVHDDKFQLLYIPSHALNQEWKLISYKSGLGVIFYGEDYYRGAMFELWSCNIVDCNPQSWKLVFSSNDLPDEIVS